MIALLNSLAAVLQVCLDDIIVCIVEGPAVLQHGFLDAVDMHTSNRG